MSSSKKWFLYLLRCADDSIYTGITTDITRRLKEHNTKKGAKAVKGRLPAVLVYSEEHGSRSSASKREIAIKTLTHEEKVSLVGTV